VLIDPADPREIMWVAVRRENHYLNAVDPGEPPGVWHGRGARPIQRDRFAGHGGGLWELVDSRGAVAFRDRDAWASADKLARAPRRYETPEEVLAKTLAAEPYAAYERPDELRAQAEKEARREPFRPAVRHRTHGVSP
jgi:hypothetical protein